MNFVEKNKINELDCQIADEATNFWFFYNWIFDFLLETNKSFISA